MHMSTAESTGAVLVGVDGSVSSRVAVDWGARYAKLHNQPLRLVNIISSPVMMAWPEAPLPDGYLQWQEEQSRDLLDAAVATAAEAVTGVEVTTEILSGPTVATMIELTREAGIVVVGCRGRGARRSAVRGETGGDGRVVGAVDQHEEHPAGLARTVGPCVVRPSLDDHATGPEFHLALVQVGGEAQDPFVEWAGRELLPALRDL